MFCRNCGKQLQDGDRFCPGCGAMQEAASAPVAEGPQVPQYHPMPTEAAPVAEPWTPQWPPVPAEPAPVAEEQPRKKKSKMKTVLVITSIVTALALVLGVVGWFWLFGGKEVIYVRTEARTYNVDGEVTELTTWEYDDRGMMLKFEQDLGAPKSVWYEEIELYISIPGPVDGEMDSYIEYEYDDQGNVECVKYKYSSNDFDREYRYEWEYEDDRIVSVVMKDKSDTEYRGIDTEYLYSYDEDGNLIYVYYESSVGEVYCYKMAYDKEGRMTRLIRCVLEGDMIYDFSYDKEGRLEKYVYSRTTSTRYDDEIDVECTEEPYIAELEYTDDGLLRSFGDEYAYKYDGDKLVKKFAPEGEHSFRYDGDTPEDKDGNLIYDDNGCLLKVMDDEGGYTEYEYLKLTLSEEDALRHRRQQQAYFSDTRIYWITLSYLDAVPLTLPVPVNPRLLVWPVTEYRR